MGIVRKQSLYISGIVYLGFALGALNVLYLFPNYFTPEEFGLTRAMFAGVTTFVQLACLGIPAMMIKFAPYFNDRLEKDKNDFLFLSLIIPVGGFILISLLILLFRQDIVALYQKKSPIFSEYFNLIFVFSFFFLINKLLEVYTSIVFKNIIPAFIREVVIRLYHLLLIICFVFSLFNYNVFINLYALSYAIGCILLIAYLIFLKRWHITYTLSKVTKRIKGPALNYGGFLYGGGLLLILAENIDTLLIAGISGLQSTAVFAVASYIVTIIQVPQRSMNTVIAPMVAQAWKDKNVPLIDRLYKKTAITQLSSSCFIFLMIWMNIDFVFSFLPDVYSEGKNVIFIVGLARILDQGMGINGELLNTSVYWRVSFIADVIFMGLSIVLNYYLITHFGITGSAYATFISLIFFNIFRFGFVWKALNMQPFTIKSGYVFVIALVCYGLILLIPQSSFALVNAVVKSAVFTMLFLSLMLTFNVSEDVNVFFAQLKERLMPNKKQ